jgi:hypothetical protein
VIKPLPIPAEFTTPVAGCDYRGETTYGGMVKYTQRLRHCIVLYEEKLDGLKQWEIEQRRAMDARE